MTPPAPSPVLLRLVAALLLAAALAACTTNPMTGRREIILMDTQQEEEVGLQMAEQVAAEIGLVDSPALAAYVNEVGQRVARSSARLDVEYDYELVDMEEPNAFAVPGGHVFVSRGLLVYANSEAELANVLGHETAHVAGRHAAQRQTRAAGVGILAAIFTLGAAAAGGDPAAVATFGQAAAAGALASYSRDQEREADHYGQEYAQRADYDPAAMTAYFRTLEGLERLRTGTSRYPSFFDTHPPTPERVAATSARAESLARRGGPAGGRDRAAYLRRIAGLRIGPNPEEGVFEEQRFIHLDLGVTLRFPDAWRTQNSRREVAALAPREDAVIRLELQGPGNDAEAAAAAFLNANRLPVHEAKALRIGGAPAFHVVGSAPFQGAALAVDLTFVARDGLIFRITGLTPGERYAGYQGAFRATAHGFRSPTDEERAGIEGLRLGIVEARAGETLAALSERSGNRWSSIETAVANGRPAEEPLAAGELVKVAVAEPFTGSRPAATEPAASSDSPD